MPNYNKILFILIFVLLFTSSTSFGAPIPYKKKVLILPFENPPGWLGDYNPGALVADLLKNKIAGDQNIILVSTKSSKKFKTGQQTLLKVETPAQTIVTGRILQSSSVFPAAVELEENPIIEVKVEFQILDGRTHRILEKTLFQKTIPLKVNPAFAQDPLDSHSVDFYESPMGRLLDQLTDQWIPHFRKYLNGAALAGQIIEIEPDNKILVNVGRLNGIEVRDDFTVYEVSPNFKDRKHNTDLGDRYTQLGVIRIKIVQEGFSEGVIVAGENFTAGNLILSKRIKPTPIFKSKPSRFPTKPATSNPDPDIQPTLSVSSPRVARTPFYSMDFFSIMGLRLEY